MVTWTKKNYKQAIVSEEDKNSRNMMIFIQKIEIQRQRERKGTGIAVFNDSNWRIIT